MYFEIPKKLYRQETQREELAQLVTLDKWKQEQGKPGKKEKSSGMAGAVASTERIRTWV